MTPERLALYRRLADVEVVEGPGGGAVLAAVDPHRPGLGLLGALEGGLETIRAGERHLASRGCTQVIAPLEVSTWFAYRARVEDGGEPPFFGEPLGAATAWLSAGYQERERYLSTVVPCEQVIAHGAGRRPPGLSVRPMEDGEEALEMIYALTHRAFTDAFLFSPLPRPVFEALYRPLLAQVDPRLVLLVERDGAPVAFMLGLPAALSGKAGRFVIKSTAVVPEARREGLLTWLAAHLHGIAAELGYTEGVHALMSARGYSQRVCPGRTFREYALFGGALS